MINHPRRQELILFLKNLREEIILAFQKFEKVHAFKREIWNYSQQGGGEISLLRGEVFEKAAVNWSGIGGTSFPLPDAQGAFHATGISVITHMANPHAPTAHFNLRFIETEKKCWFGGGYDLTPMGFPYPEDSSHFHRVAKNALEDFGENVYSTFAQNAKEYFYIPHRHKERGVGGLFFDHYATENFENDLEIWKTVGHSFLPALIPIYEKRVDHPFSSIDREKQLHHRSHYVEFNLLYDKGTRFGFQSGGNPDAILCSMPPLVKW